GDARPGGYVAAGGHGGILGNISHLGPVLVFQPTRCHTYLSQVNVTRLPASVMGLQRQGGALVSVPVAIKNAQGELLSEAVPRVSIVKSGNYHADHYEDEPEREVDILARLEQNFQDSPLGGFVTEGLSPYGTPTAKAPHMVLLRAVYSGMPVVAVGRGNNEGFTAQRDVILGGNNLTATKARLLLMACLMKLGSLPPAADPDHPTEGEREAVLARLAQYQAIFDTH